jgi:2-haloacid dehalogenase
LKSSQRQFDSKICPPKKVYQWAAQKFGVGPNEMLIITCHRWDMAGTVIEGMKTAFLMKDRKLLSPLCPSPGLSYKTMAALVAHLKKKSTD